MEAVVFDMDGVIFDTERLVLEGWAETGKKHGIEGTDAVCRQCLGTTYEVSRQIFLDHYGEDFPYETYKEEMRAYFYRAIEKEVPLKPGIREILEYLKKEGFRIGTGSGWPDRIFRRGHRRRPLKTQQTGTGYLSYGMQGTWRGAGAGIRD